MRVTGGRLGGRRLRAPAGRSVRPTADRVREALFARLGDLGGERVLDLFAGSGALGIEALSRGARDAVFVERSGPVVATLRANLEALDLVACSRVVRSDAAAAIRRLARAGERFDRVLLDPPYAFSDLAEVLRELAISGIVCPGGEVILETSSRQTVPDVPGLELVDARRYGDTQIVRLRPGPTPPDHDEGEGA